MIYKFRGIVLPVMVLLTVLLVSSCVSKPPELVVVPAAADSTELNPADYGVLPEPAVPPPEPEPVIRYITSPEAGYEDGTGYIRISFAAESPGTENGKVTISIGRRQIEHANTKWYSYRFVINGREYTKKGLVSIPFVRGKDNLWWNEDQILLPEPLEYTMDLTITDLFRPNVYHFTIEKKVE